MATLARLLPVVCLGSLAIAACSGAGNADLFEPVTGENAISATEPAPDEKAPTPAAPPQETPSLPTPAPEKDAGAPQPTPPTCASEAEPNNDTSKATVFTTCLGGKIDGSSDVDYARFTVPEEARGAKLSHTESSDKVAYRVMVINGVSLPISDEIPLVAGTTYVVQVRLSGGGNDKPTWELKVSSKSDKP